MGDDLDYTCYKLSFLSLDISYFKSNKLQKMQSCKALLQVDSSIYKYFLQHLAISFVIDILSIFVMTFEPFDR